MTKEHYIAYAKKLVKDGMSTSDAIATASKKARAAGVTVDWDELSVGLGYKSDHVHESRLTDFVDQLKKVATVSSIEIMEPEGVARVVVNSRASHDQDSFHVVDLGDHYEMDLLDDDGEIVMTQSLAAGSEFTPGMFKRESSVKESAVSVVMTLLSE
jgi:hypothetical protein